ncbi:MAG: DUF4091 domain-containing protein [Bryobacteraceae bacterium]|nr:DUF4091 domain-containing protein [Bryobacterales bacterium]MEB2361301.1 DUF4091 domain-containing protein [Bryobacterales bacterium]NUN02193.1 DUF4091 domain-containing protein [Bryobacteraceae bacterium]
MALKCPFAFLVCAAAFAQPGGLPVPPVPAGIEEEFLPVSGDMLQPSDADRQRGWLLYQRDRNFELLPNSRPAPGEALTTLRITATPGEMESQPFSIYALREIPAIRPELRGPSWLKIEDVLFHPVQLRTKSMGGSSGEFDTTRIKRIGRFVRYPVFLRSVMEHAVPAGSSRLYWVTASVPPDAAPGLYQATLRMSQPGGAALEAPLEVRVLPFRLDDPGVRFGAFLSGRKFEKGEWALMKRYGMDALQWFWGSHPIRIQNDAGKLRLDFTEFDAFVRGMQQAGMRGPIVPSLGNSWLGMYEIALARAFDLRLMKRNLGGREVTLMDMTDPRWEKPYIEGLRQIFAHAKEAGWPPLALLINDEPTKFIMAYHPYRYHLLKKHFPEVPVYGVFFEPRKDPGPLLHSCDIVVANRDLERMSRLAREFGKRFWTYNNITADQSFGKCRLLYGQIPAFYGSEAMFFWSWNYYINNPWNDFDGRGEANDPLPQSDADWVAVYPSVDGVEPVRTLAFEAAREGIDDVRYLKTLENLVKGKDPSRWEALRAEIHRRQEAMFQGIVLDNRIYTDAEFFVTTRNDDVERLRDFVIREILKSLGDP